MADDTSVWTNLPRAILPALLGSAAAGVAWWVMADLPPGARWGLRGAGWLIQSLYLFLITTAVPNVVGLTLLSRWLSRHRPANVFAKAILALLIGAVYGGAILVTGIIVGFAVFLTPMVLLTPKQAIPGMVGGLLFVGDFYPVAAIGGIVSVTGLMASVRKS